MVQVIGISSHEIHVLSPPSYWQGKRVHGEHIYIVNTMTADV